MNHVPPSPDLLRLRNLRVNFAGAARPALAGLDLTMRRGEIRALVGESGSGKTMLARALVDLLPTGAQVEADLAEFDGVDLLASEDARRGLRGRSIAFIFQEPLSSLNPTLRIGVQLTEALATHSGRRLAACRDEAIEMLHRVKLHAPEDCLLRYPHELSGGMRQRVMIAAALITRPALVIADEPTTALDLVVQHEVLGLLRSASREIGSSVLLITHDLSVVAGVADQVTVLQNGLVVEDAPAASLLSRPQHPYTRRLLDAVFRTADTPRPRAAGTRLLEVSRLSVEMRSARKGRPARILDDVTLDIDEGETLAVIGESGSGKTTLSRAVCGLLAATSGTIRIAGDSIETARRNGDVQLVFQDPFGSLDPRMTVGDTILEGLRVRGARADPAQALRALQQVGLDPALATRLPHQLSGGQRQRVGIARAVIVRPRLLVADEPVSALDLTVQKEILDLLRRLQRELGFACLFVSHDLGVVEHVADRVCVLLHGHVVEIGPRAAVFDSPGHPYTQLLIASTPLVERSDGGGFAIRPRAVHVASDESIVWFDPRQQTGDRPTYRTLRDDHLVATLSRSDAAA